jgi:acyl dehydratase
VTKQRCWEDVAEGEELPPLRFPLTVFRLVAAAGATRDYNAIHHNTEIAQASGAPEMYANTLFLLGMWERSVREYIGLDGRIRRIAGARMRSFNTVGDEVIVRGRVVGKRLEERAGIVELEVWTENRNGISVGPGTVTVTMPLRS